jgi:hypothetical protein
MLKTGNLGGRIFILFHVQPAQLFVMNSHTIPYCQEILNVTGLLNI